MITIDDIDMDVDYKELSFVESHLMHELKRKGKVEFVKIYGGNIEEFRKDWNKVHFCFLLALLEYLDSGFKYDESIRLDKYVLDSRDYIILGEDNDVEIINNSYEEALESFRYRGFLYREIEEAV